MKCPSALSFMLLVPCLSVMAPAQSTNATISGVVVDPLGNVIPEAIIVILNEGTGVHYFAKTNSVGIYSVTILPPGQYRVQVSKPGFKTLIKPGIVLNVQSAVALNFTLPLGASSVSITVEGGASPMNTTDGSVSTVIDRRFVENIPLNGRSFQDLISMTPGVVTESPQTSGQAPGAFGDFSVNGQRTESNYYTVDGVTANVSGGNGGGVGEPSSAGTLGASTALGTTQSMIPVDALQEFRVRSSTYSAEYGHSPGGQFALVTRSGTNLFRGMVYDYLRNNFFDANDWFNDYFGKPTPALRQNDFGGTVGGPAWIPRIYNGKDRTFFFASYEGLRLDQPTAAAVQYVPDLSMRARAPTAIQPILNAYPLPNGIDYGTSADPSLAQFTEPYSLPSRIASTSIRVDHLISPKLSVFFRFGDTPSSTATRQYFALDTITSNVQTYTLGATSQLSRAITNEFRLGYARSDSSDIGVIDNFGGATPVNLGTVTGSSSSDSRVLIYIPGVGESLLGPYYGKNATRQWNLVDTLALPLGHHALKLGVDYRHIDAPVTAPAILTSTEWTSTAALLSNRSTASLIENNETGTPLFNETALFVQDEWRLTSRVNVSLGVRWELDPPPTGKNGKDAYTLLGSIGDPSSLTLAPEGTPLWRTGWFNFAPRLGSAWKVRNRPGREMVLRTGGGVFFDTANELAAEGYSSIGFEAFTISRGLAIPYTESELRVPLTPAPPYEGTIIAFPSHLQLPYTLEWNTSVEQTLGKSQTFTISYVGSNGRRLIGLQELSIANLNSMFPATIEYVAGGITSNYQALEGQFQRSIGQGIQALASYTWSHSIDFGSSAEELPVQRGNSDFDIRNNFQGGVSWDLPTISSTPFATLLSNGWAIDARLNARGGFPVPIEGSELIDPATGIISYGQLNLVPGQPTTVYGSQYPGGRAINRAAFALPAMGISGDAPRNLVRGFGATQLNMAVRRELHLHDALALQVRAETFNILNHPNFGYVDSAYTDETFGQATKMLNQSLGTVAAQYQQGGPRSMQFALKLYF